ncbi:AGAP013176-PA-like protein [Anopheles sinensis]|uniref:AGAP013176-PA-like protein n=1 Tax=Anopheles sinensis TaxID=74873 RepID=A0A084W588_ANOSI|nr:AGAP013176-PA-like protein [Anopheles sinensis]
MVLPSPMATPERLVRQLPNVILPPRVLVVFLVVLLLLLVELELVVEVIATTMGGMMSAPAVVASHDAAAAAGAIGGGSIGSGGGTKSVQILTAGGPWLSIGEVSGPQLELISLRFAHRRTDHYDQHDEHGQQHQYTADRHGHHRTVTHSS